MTHTDPVNECKACLILDDREMVRAKYGWTPRGFGYAHLQGEGSLTWY